MDIIEPICIVIGIVAGLIVIILAIKNSPVYFFNKRVVKFIELRKNLSKNFHYIKNIINEDWVEDGHPNLFCLSGWNHQKGAKLRKIDDIELIADNTNRNYNKIKNSINKYIVLPKKNLSIVDNLEFVPDKGELYNATTYGISRIEVNEDKINMHIKRGEYYDYINTCFGYGYEASHAYIHTKLNVQPKLRLRQKYKSIDFDNRLSQIGISTLVIVKNMRSRSGTRHSFLLQHRGDEVASDRGLITPVPGGSFQPSKENAKKELDIALKEDGLKHTIIREFLEEILSVPEAEYLPSTRLLNEHKIWDILNDNIYYLGCGIHPINTYFEVLTCVVIDIEQPDVKEIMPTDICGNFEGTIKTNEPFRKETLEYYAGLPKSTSALIQTCKVILSDYDGITLQLGISENT